MRKVRKPSYPTSRFQVGDTFRVVYDGKYNWTMTVKDVYDKHSGVYFVDATYGDDFMDFWVKVEGDKVTHSAGSAEVVAERDEFDGEITP